MDRKAQNITQQQWRMIIKTRKTQREQLQILKRGEKETTVLRVM